MLEPAGLYSNLHTQPAWSAWKARLKYWQRHDPSALFKISFDPVLGWDTADLLHYRPHPSSGFTKTIITIGDSFTYGADVLASENYSFVLDEMLGNSRVLNMGVLGYGIDQAYLKYLEHGEHYQPDVVVFGIYVGDYERTSSTFTSFAKPTFMVEQDRVVLTNQPVPSPHEVLAATEDDFSGRWYTVELLANAKRKIDDVLSPDTSYYETTDIVITHLLQDLRDRLGPSRLIIVHIPRAEAFVEQNDGRRGEMNSRLLAIYDKLGLETVDLNRVFTEKLEGNEVFAEYYVHLEGGSVGHLSPHGHKRVAEQLFDLLAPVEVVSERNTVATWFRWEDGGGT